VSDPATAVGQSPAEALGAANGAVEALCVGTGQLHELSRRGTIRARKREAGARQPWSRRIATRGGATSAAILHMNSIGE
jgi:hypothetical protein